MNIFIFTENFSNQNGGIHCTPADWAKEQLPLFDEQQSNTSEIIVHKKEVQIDSKKDIIVLDSILYDFTVKALRFAEEQEIPLLIVNFNNNAHLPKVQEYPIIFKKESQLDDEEIFNLIQTTKDKLPRGTGRYFTKFFSVDELVQKYQPQETNQPLFQ